MTESKTTAIPEAKEDWLPEQRARARKAAIAGGVGTLIEYYEFSVYGYVAIVIGPQFFPNVDPVISLLSALAVFATAYFMRPVGGIVFGYIGDRFGRKTALLSTLVMMGAASVAMGLLPTYGQIGIGAALLLLLVRLVQGFSAGGEVGGSATFISESAPRRLRATYGAFTPLGATLGFAMASAVAGTVSALTTDEEFTAWGWRIPFLLALPLTIFCVWIRSRVDETLKSPSDGATEARHGAPIISLLRRQPLALLQATGIAIAANGTAYVGLSYMSIHLVQRLGYDRTAVYWVTTIVIAIAAFAMPLGGIMADKIGHLRVTIIGLVGFAVLTYPAMAVMNNGLLIAGFAFLLIMVNTVSTQVGSYTLLPRLFKTEFRYTGVATGWNLGVVVAGGTAPYVSVQLIEATGNVLSPAFFVIGASVIGLASVAAIARTSGYTGDRFGS
jgi:MHS family proline/betaine transporter-like MFS transporter